MVELSVFCLVFKVKLCKGLSNERARQGISIDRVITRGLGLIKMRVFLILLITEKTRYFHIEVFQ